MQEKLNRKYFLFMMPAIIMVIVLRFFPIGNAFRMCLYDWNGYSQEMTFVGLENFVEIFKDDYLWKALINTLMYAFGITIVKNILGLVLALFVNIRFKGRDVVRAIIYLPIMISGFIMGRIMYYFYQYDGGIFNEIITVFGGEPIYWMETGLQAVLVIIMTSSIIHVGSTMLTYLAGLQRIPHELRESARLDGANKWNEFWYITLPLLNPAIISSVILNLIASFKIYDIITALSGGGPDGGSQSLTMLISKYYFGHNRAGYAAAMAMIFFFLVVIVTLPINKYLSSKKVQF
jgi:raffinose/stachyose/melibiose transport system permease protein